MLNRNGQVNKDTALSGFFMSEMYENLMSFKIFHIRDWTA